MAQAGLIESNINETDPFKTVQGYTPETRTLNPATDTVEGRVTSLMKTDNPLMTGARARASEAANSRGLLNSTMAVQAGETAAYGAALPIAAADASAVNQQGQLNQAATNRSLEFNATGKNTMSGELGLQKLRGSQAEVLAQIEASYKNLLQGSASSSQMFTSTSKNVNDIMSDSTLSAAQKESAIEKQTSMLLAHLTVVGRLANADIASLLDFGGSIPQPPVPQPAPQPAPDEPPDPGYGGGD